MKSYEKSETVAFSFKAIIGKAFYVKGVEVWIVNTNFYTPTTTIHQTELKQQLTQESKNYIPIAVHIYTLNRFTKGDESSLKALFKTIRAGMDESHADSLEKIAALLGIPFNKAAYLVACKKKAIEALFQAATIRPVSIPQWVSPFIRSKLKILNAAHEKGGNQ